MKCVKCNSELPDGAKFCNACGASQEAPKPTKCVKCGTELPDGAKFCNACGVSQDVPKPTKCVKCGTELPDGAKFCNACGASQEVPKTEAMKKCAKCGTELPVSFKFCDGCGAPQNGQPVPPPQTAPVQPQIPPPQTAPVQPQIPPPQAPAAPQVPDGPQKSRTVYQILALLLGGLGIHNFYAGYTGRGIAQLLLCWTGISGIWALIEVFVVSKDAKGVPMKPSNLALILLILILGIEIVGSILEPHSYDGYGYGLYFYLSLGSLISCAWALFVAIAVSKDAKDKGIKQPFKLPFILLFLALLLPFLMRFSPHIIREHLFLSMPLWWWIVALGGWIWAFFEAIVFRQNAKGKGIKQPSEHLLILLILTLIVRLFIFWFPMIMRVAR